MHDPAKDEPGPLTELAPFEEGDFHALSDPLSRDAQYNDRRLHTRRKLGSIAKLAAERAKQEHGIELLARTSLHQPHAFNHQRVRRLWAYLARAKAEKRRLAGVLGAELAKDLDAAYRNAYLCVALEEDTLEVSLRIHVDAWYDGQNAANRVRSEGARAWLAELNRLDGYFLRLDDWKGEWRLGSLAPERLEEFLRYWKPGEHALRVERRWPAARGARAPLCQPNVPLELVGEVLRLAPLYRWMAWSKESDFLFNR